MNRYSAASMQLFPGAIWKMAPSPLDSKCLHSTAGLNYCWNISPLLHTILFYSLNLPSVLPYLCLLLLTNFAFPPIFLFVSVCMPISLCLSWFLKGVWPTSGSAPSLLLSLHCRITPVNVWKPNVMVEGGSGGWGWKLPCKARVLPLHILMIILYDMWIISESNLSISSALYKHSVNFIVSGVNLKGIEWLEYIVGDFSALEQGKEWEKFVNFFDVSGSWTLLLNILAYFP